MKLVPGAGIEASGRFVHKNDLRRSQHRKRDVDAASLTTGQATQRPIDKRVEAEEFRHLSNQSMIDLTAPIHRVIAGAMFQDASRRPPWVVLPRLKNDAHLGAPALVAVPGFDTEHLDVTR